MKLQLLRCLLVGLALLQATDALSADTSTDYPNRAVRLIVPYPAGGVTDVLARTLTGKLTTRWGQTVIVEARGGASGNIGSNFVAKAAPDGYVLLFGTASTHTINPALFKNLPFDPVRDFIPITIVAQIPNVLLVHPSLGVRSVHELIALAKASPGTLNYASSGNGTTTHLAGELFKLRANVDIVHVPYKGSSIAMQDLLGGRISIMFENIPTTVQWVKNGRLLALAVTGTTRSPAFPEVPTVAEAGVSNFKMSGWSGVFAPAGTPIEIVNKIYQSISEVIALPDVREAFLSNGAEPLGTSPQEMAQRMQSELIEWRDVVRISGATVD